MIDMKKITTLTLLILTICSHTAEAQSPAKYFYYYQGKQITLSPDYASISVTAADNAGNNLVQRIAGSTGFVQEDAVRQALVTIDNEAAARQFQKTLYAEIKSNRPLADAEYNNRLMEYRQLPGIDHAVPCFVLPNGKKIGTTNQFYVQLRNPADVDALYETARQLNVEVLGHNRFMYDWFVLACHRNSRMNALDAANYFHETRLFTAAEPAFMLHDLKETADPLYPTQWALLNTGQHGAAFAGIDIRAEGAWAITTGSPNIRTVVMDEGFEQNHPDYATNNFGNGYNTFTASVPSVVYGSHGTACAGIVGALQNNNLGGSGVAPGSRLISVSINFGGTNYNQLADGINWSWQNGADVISNSWGGGTPSALFNTAINNALTNGRAGRGTVVVFSSGNNNGAVAYPANSNPGILAVGAMSPCGQRKTPTSCDGETWWGSNFGNEQDVVAPGVLIPTTDRQGTNGYTTNDYTPNFNGTSAACPHVAGVAALVLSINGNLTAIQVNDIIERSAQKVRADLYGYANTGGRTNGTWNNEMGYGLINAQQAVILAGGNACTADLTVNTNVVAPNIDNRQASNSITAVNNIANGARGVYHAGGFVLLNPGFTAEPGSGLNAYIEGCSGNFIYRSTQDAAQQPTYTYRYLQGTEPAVAESRTSQLFTASPNVFSTTTAFNFRINEGEDRFSVDVYTVQGSKVANVQQNNKAMAGAYRVDWKDIRLPAGIYLVTLTTNKGAKTIRVVKK